MTSKSYNGFSGAYRDQQGALINENIRNGVWPAPTHCVGCLITATETNLQKHLEDYDSPETFVGICSKCHWAIHTRESKPKAWTSYLKTVRAKSGLTYLHLLNAGAVGGPKAVRTAVPASTPPSAPIRPQAPRE
jgi:hypothetical protein